MKIIHTSDWHLGNRLYNYDRTDEEEDFFKKLAGVVAAEEPDALVISGDVFDTGVPGNDVAKRFTERLLDVLAKCPEMETVIIAGNHDSYSRLVVDEALWKRFRVHVFGRPAEDEEGKAVFEGNVVELPGKGVIAAVPFCHPRNFPMVPGATGENREKNFFAGLAQYVAERSKGLPAVLMAHLAVKGEIDLRGHDKTLVIGGEECVDASEFGEVYSYIALGHIHCPQWIRGGRKVARYCGAPRVLRFDEACEHGVDVVTVEAGREPEVRTVAFAPLHALVTLGGDDGMAFEDALRAVAATDAPADTYIRLNVRLGACELPKPDWTELARNACCEKEFRFCVNNPIRAEEPEQRAEKKNLTMEELKGLSNDQVIQILSSRQRLSERQCELIKSLMEEEAQI